jgi:hypothetical protein
MKKSIKIENYDYNIDCLGNYSLLNFQGVVRISKEELKLVDFEEIQKGFCEINIPEKKIDLSLVSEKQLIDELIKREMIIGKIF